MQHLEDEVRARYAAHRRLSRRAHDRNDEGYRALGLGGAAPTARGDLFNTAGTFWQTVTERPDLVAEVRGLSPEKAQQALLLLEEARQAAVAQLRHEAGELVEVARLALEDRPQTLEALGLRA